MDPPQSWYLKWCPTKSTTIALAFMYLSRPSTFHPCKSICGQEVTHPFVPGRLLPRKLQEESNYLSPIRFTCIFFMFVYAFIFLSECRRISSFDGTCAKWLLFNFNWTPIHQCNCFLFLSCSTLLYLDQNIPGRCTVFYFYDI